MVRTGGLFDPRTTWNWRSVHANSGVLDGGPNCSTYSHSVGDEAGYCLRHAARPCHGPPDALVAEAKDQACAVDGAGGLPTSFPWIGGRIARDRDRSVPATMIPARMAATDKPAGQAALPQKGRWKYRRWPRRTSPTGEALASKGPWLCYLSHPDSPRRGFISLQSSKLHRSHLYRRRSMGALARQFR